MAQVRIAELMTSAVEWVAPDEAFDRVARRMHERRLSCLVVCRDEAPIGVISERDLVRVLAESLHGASLPVTAADVMSSPAISVLAGSTAADAMRRKRTRGIRRLVVVDEAGRLMGLVTQTDLLRAHALEIEKQGATLTRLVEERTRELREANDRLESLSLLDGLLGIGNRRAMEAALEKQRAHADRYRRPYAVALLDVDHFKAFNDRYGHPVADDVLQRLAVVLSDVLRGADSIYRYGGEEILMLLPETDGAGARQAAERARQAVEALGIEHAGSPLGLVTVSVGVAVSSGHDRPTGWGPLVEAADDALYAAKRAGRNRVEAAPQP